VIRMNVRVNNCCETVTGRCWLERGQDIGRYCAKLVREIRIARDQVAAAATAADVTGVLIMLVSAA